MFCSKCGASVSDGDYACWNCGNVLGSGAANPGAQPPVKAQPPVHAAPSDAMSRDSASILTYGILSAAFACSFFASFVGIIFGCITKRKVEEYAYYGCGVFGRARVGSILGKVGFWAGIGMTILFAVYIFAIVAIVCCATAFSY